jgi:hypothetical protein
MKAIELPQAQTSVNLFKVFNLAVVLQSQRLCERHRKTVYLQSDHSDKVKIHPRS